MDFHRHGENTLDLRSRVVSEARRWIGTPYIHQASALDAGADCLGLIRGVWRACIGPEPCQPPAYTKDWSEASGEEVLMAAADLLLRRYEGAMLSGHVLLFRMRDGSVAKHLGIVSQTGPEVRFIHAYSGHGVLESTLSDPWKKRIAHVYEFPEGAI